MNVDKKALLELLNDSATLNGELIALCQLNTDSRIADVIDSIASDANEINDKIYRMIDRDNNSVDA